MGSVTVTSGASDAQIRAVRGLDRSDSQADSAGSIPVTRSKKPQVKTVTMVDTPKVKGSLRSSRAHRLAFRVLANCFSSRRARSKR